MPVFTAAAAYIAGAFGVTSAFGVALINFGVRAIASYTLTNLMAKRSGTNAKSPELGNRLQLSPASDNKLQIVYGSAFVSPIITDAKISTDNSTMWYVMALSEATDTGTISFTRQWWGDKELFFDETDTTKVSYWINSNDQTSNTINGNMYIYYYGNGSNDPLNTDQTAIQVLQNSGIAVDQRWTSDHLMSNTAFAIVKVIYNQNAGITGLEQFKVQLNNSLKQPGSVIKDYLSNARYGCGIALSNIDTASLDELDAYSAVTIPYTDPNGNPATQARYEINGPINTNNDCLTNLQQLVDSCDSWLQFNEIEGKWGVVINQSYTDYTTYEELFIIDNNNVVSGVDITPVDLNSTFNSVEGQFPNYRSIDKTDFTYIEIDAEDRSPNEPENQLVLQLPQVNNFVQAKYLATRRLIQSREDLIVNVKLDYSGIQLVAGDVVRVQQPVYGWGPLPDNPSNPDKLFRVVQMAEEKSEDGNLGARVTLTEYNEQVYQNIDISDYIPASNTGISDPGWISTPGAPTVTIKQPSYEGETASFEVSATVPATGLVLYMDFMYGTNSDPSTHKLYRTVTPSNGRAFVNGSTVTIIVNDLPPGTYYWSIRARGTSEASSSDQGSSSAPSVWDGMKVLAPILVAGALLGGIGKNLLRPDAQPGSPIRGLGYNPSINDNDPILVTSTSVRNVPLIFPGSSIPSSNIFPWYQGTDPISTGPWMPRIAVVWPITEGTDGWYKVGYFDNAGTTVEYGENILMTIQFNFLASVSNLKFQLCPYIIVSGVSDLQLQTDGLQTITIPDAEPYPYGITVSRQSTVQAGYSGIESGWVIRNITPSSNLTAFSASGLWQQLLNKTIA